jgi:hypothetical protein
MNFIFVNIQATIQFPGGKLTLSVAIFVKLFVCLVFVYFGVVCLLYIKRQESDKPIARYLR